MTDDRSDDRSDNRERTDDRSEKRERKRKRERERETERERERGERARARSADSQQCGGDKHTAGIKLKEVLTSGNYRAGAHYSLLHHGVSFRHSSFSS